MKTTRDIIATRAPGLLPPAVSVGALLLAALLAAGSACAADPAIRLSEGETTSGAGVAGEIPREKLERWRSLSHEQQERIRERYRRWKELPPEQRERIIERQRQTGKLPPEQRDYLRQRRDMLRDARPADRVVARKFFARLRALPPDARRRVKRKIREWRSLPEGEREGQMLSWPFYRNLNPSERGSLRWFLFSDPASPRG